MPRDAQLHFACLRANFKIVNLDVEPLEKRPSIFEDHLRRAFGDEIARVSRLPLRERYRYVAWMIDNGREHGVKHRREPLRRSRLVSIQAFSGGAVVLPDQFDQFLIVPEMSSQQSVCRFRVLGLGGTIRRLDIKFARVGVHGIGQL